MLMAPRIRKIYFQRSIFGFSICPIYMYLVQHSGNVLKCGNGRTPYARKPPKIPAQPLNEYQMRDRNGTSRCEYQIDVRMVMPGVTIASIRPRKKLRLKSRA